MAAKVPTAPASPLAAPADPAATAAAAAPVNAPAVDSTAADAAADALITTGAEVNSENNGNIPSAKGAAPADTGVDPALAAAAAAAAATQAENSPRKGRMVRNVTSEEYEEISASDSENVKRKDAAVLEGRRVLKVGTGTGAVYRIYK